MDETTLEQAYFEYNPEEDYNGKIGLEIAETVFKRCKYNFNELHKWIMVHRCSRLEKEAHKNRK